MGIGRLCGILAAVLGVLPAAAQARAISAYVVLGEAGAPQVRVVTAARACPSIVVDGHRRSMAVRARPATLPVRLTASAPELSKAADFPVLVCEAALPRSARRASVEGQRLPLPKARIDRIVVIGDTGCRLKASDDAYQACNDPAAYPFARVARRAAAWKPDLVLHVGDYEYRENPCAPGHPGCAGSPWGYGWDAWRADFFGPAAPLLAAAPWVAIRGNHEDCARAGQGWFRLLDPRPLASGRDCIDPANDVVTDDSAPYAVPLGGGAQIVALDMTTAPNAATPRDDPRYAQFAADYAALDRLTQQARYTFTALHKPILGFAAVEHHGEIRLRPATPGIQSVFESQNPAILPAGVGVVLSGHVHVWQQASFASDHPSQFIAGFSGTQEDTVPIPRVLPADATPAMGATVAHFSSWIAGFGYMTLERRAADRWTAKIWNLDGQVVNRCEIEGRRSRCLKPQV